MLSLNIETSRNLTSVSLSDDYQIKNILNVNSERPNHCELLSPLIKDLFESIPFSLHDIQQVRVNVGPGNLSSLRVGIATANSISSFSRIPVYGISSFLLYAYSYQYEFKNLVTNLKDSLKEKTFFKDLRKEVNTSANGTQDYVVKKGANKDTIATTRQ